MPSQLFSAPFVVASIAAHALVLTAMGHAPPRAAVALVAAPDALVDVELTPPARDEETAAPAPATAPPAAAPAHRHAYPVAHDHDARPHDPSLVHLPIAASPPKPAPASAPEPAPASAPEPAPAHADAAPPRFALSVTNAPASAPSGAGGAAHAHDDGEGADGAPLPESRVSSPARVLVAVTPAYPAAARAEGVEGDVAMSLVVSSRGIVLDAQIARPAGYGFDEAALRAARAARFEPARRDGHAVAVRMRWTVSFRLR